MHLSLSIYTLAYKTQIYPPRRIRPIAWLGKQQTLPTSSNINLGRISPPLPPQASPPLLYNHVPDIAPPPSPPPHQEASPLEPAHLSSPSPSHPKRKKTPLKTPFPPPRTLLSNAASPSTLSNPVHPNASHPPSQTPQAPTSPGKIPQTPHPRSEGSASSLVGVFEAVGDNGCSNRVLQWVMESGVGSGGVRSGGFVSGVHLGGPGGAGFERGLQRGGC